MNRDWFYGPWAQQVIYFLMQQSLMTRVSEARWGGKMGKRKRGKVD